MTNLTGDYVIAIGGRHGVVKIGRRWKTFGCSICMRNKGLLQRRIGTNDNPTAAGKLGGTPSDFSCLVSPKHK